MIIDGEVVDRTEAIVETYRSNKLDALVCIGGGGTAKNAMRLAAAGINVVHVPKTIDNDVAMTDATIGFATALDVATEAIDRLHSTAHSHHRIIVAEAMGHRSGWLALGAGIAAGADVILIPEIPYEIDSIVTAIRRRTRKGTNFSIVAVAEGARDRALAGAADEPEADSGLSTLGGGHVGHTLRLAEQLEARTGLESRVTILGHIQRGGTPSPADRLLATRLGVACTDFIAEGIHGVMVAARGDGAEAVDLKEIAGKRRSVPLDHPMVHSARSLGISFGD
jgi:6-phosphofructokinase 1